MASGTGATAIGATTIVVGDCNIAASGGGTVPGITSGTPTATTGLGTESSDPPRISTSGGRGTGETISPVATDPVATPGGGGVVCAKALVVTKTAVSAIAVTPDNNTGENLNVLFIITGKTSASRKVA
jgi:hypothetical protein